VQTIEEKAGPPGFLLLSASMKPLLVNTAAAQILAYPSDPKTEQNLDGYLAKRIRSALFSDQSSRPLGLVPRFISGRRTYWCRGFQVNSAAHGNPEVSIAVLLERAPVRPPSLTQLFERFHLTMREQAVTKFLLQGLASKEIGVRMEISPNTVKSFVRLIMMKMGVSTRSGIVGKALTQDSDEA